MVDHYNLDLGKLENRAVLSRAALWAFIAVSVVEMVCAWLEFTSRVDLESGDDILTMSVGFVYLAYFFVFVAAIVMVAMWIHRAHANLFASGAGGLEFTPSWSVGWFFVPFASLFKPFQAMRELWNGSYGASDSYSGYTPPEVGRWWGAWIGGNILATASTRIEMAGGTEVGLALDLTSSALMIAAGMFLIQIIRGVTEAQVNGGIAAQVFS